jgi:hypothetical protein
MAATVTSGGGVVEANAPVAQGDRRVVHDVAAAVAGA